MCSKVYREFTSAEFPIVSYNLILLSYAEDFFQFEKII